MNTAKIVSVFLMAILVSTTASSQPPLTFKSNLDQAQAFGTGSAATGTAILSFNSTVRELNMLIAFNGLTTAQITGFHIRRAPAGTPGGPIVFGLVNPNHDVNDFSDLGFGYFSRWDITDTLSGAAYPAGSLNGACSICSTNSCISTRRRQRFRWGKFVAKSSRSYSETSISMVSKI